MLSQEKVIEAIKNGDFESGTIDGRDYSRLVEFFPASDWGYFCMEVREGFEDGDSHLKEWTEKNVLEQLKEDLEFAFEKALDCRSLSAGAMYHVVKMWLWVLEDELQEFDEYQWYGLPLLKRVAVKYNFDNPIGEDTGDESKYSGR